MKKYSWIVALLLALTLAFFGCPSPGDDDDDDDDEEPINPPVLEEKVVLDLAELLQEMDAGENDPEVIFADPRLAAADDNHTQASYEIIDEDGVNKLKVTVTPSWAGFDLTHPGNGFRAGDKIEIKGKLVSPAAQVLLNMNHAGWDPLGNWNPSLNPGDEFEQEFTLTAADVTKIATASPPAIRVRTNQANAVFIIEQIKITGMRPSQIVALPAPVITETARGVAWEAVEGANGYKVYADEAVLATLPSTATNINLNAQESLEVDTEYSITVVALGSAGSSLDSAPSNAIVYTHKLPSVPTTYQVPEGGADFFFVNLNDWETIGAINATIPDGVLAADKITLTFTEQAQRVNFKLTDAQKTILTSAAKIDVTIVGTSDPETSSFRYHIGDALLGSSWNATSGNGEGALSTILSNTLNLDNKTGTLLDFFILQFERNTSAPAETTVEIESIKIAVHIDTVSLAAIAGVTAPVLGATPVTAITPTAQYTGTVAWADADGTALDGAFAASTAYTATITLSPTANYTLTGVAADFFTVAGATATNPADSGTVTAVFPATGASLIAIDIAAIAGVTAPAMGATPVTAITPTVQYTGTVAWADGDGTALTGTFAASTAYTATITLTPTATYTLTGVAANFFTVTGATATNPADSGTVTAVFPATAAALIPISGQIDGVTAPETGATPVSTITENAQFTGTVTWSPAIAEGGTFAAETTYTATIILTPKAGYTITGVIPNSFTVEDATATNLASSGTVTAVFPETAAADATEYVDIEPVLTSNQDEGGTQGTWNGTVTDNHAEWTGGAVRYTFPTAEGFDINDYDFFEIEYTDGAGGVILKQLTTGTDFGFVSNQYPTLTAEGTFTFQIRGAGTSGGIAFQRNNGNASITITKVTFTKGVRVTITFDPDGGSAVAPITNAVVGTVIGPLPTTTRSGYIFDGWVDSADDPVNSATPVPESGMALKATWNEAVAVSPITVNFSTATVTATGGTITNQTATGFTFVGSANYGGAYAKFTVNLPAGSLASYGSVTVTINGTSGDTNYKDIWLLAGKPIPSGSLADPALSQDVVMGTFYRYDSGTQTRTIPIAAGKGGSLTGDIELCIYLHANTSTFEFSNVTLNVREDD